MMSRERRKTKNAGHGWQLLSHCFRRDVKKQQSTEKTPPIISQQVPAEEEGVERVAPLHARVVIIKCCNYFWGSSMGSTAAVVGGGHGGPRHCEEQEWQHCRSCCDSGPAVALIFDDSLPHPPSSAKKRKTSMFIVFQVPTYQQRVVLPEQLREEGFLSSSSFDYWIRSSTC